jgi:hypothetical protein
MPSLTITSSRSVRYANTQLLEKISTWPSKQIDMISLRGSHTRMQSIMYFYRHFILAYRIR